MRNECSLIIPCFNEFENIKKILDEKIEVLNQNKIEVIFVDNGSTDNTNDLLIHHPNQKYYKVIRLNNNLGYGGGIKEGLKKSSTDFLSWSHADLQTDLFDVIHAKNLLDQKDNENIIIKGKRKNKRSFIKNNKP